MSRKTHVIALVENDQACLRALRRLLLASGYDVEVYRSAEEFLAAARRARRSAR